MSIVSTKPRKVNVLTISAEADGSLASYQDCVVIYSGAASGLTKVKAPTAANVVGAGVCQNAPATGLQAEVMVQGICEIKASTTFNSGVELAIADTSGRVEAAASGDYVVAMSLEASSATNQLVTCLLVSSYQKN